MKKGLVQAAWYGDISPVSRWPAQSHSHMAFVADIWPVRKLGGFYCQGSSWRKHRAKAALASESFLLWTDWSERIRLGLPPPKVQRHF